MIFVANTAVGQGVLPCMKGVVMCDKHLPMLRKGAVKKIAYLFWIHSKCSLGGTSLRCVHGLYRVCKYPLGL